VIWKGLAILGPKLQSLELRYSGGHRDDNNDVNVNQKMSLALWESRAIRPGEGPSPAATASDPPASGRVTQHATAKTQSGNMTLWTIRSVLLPG